MTTEQPLQIQGPQTLVLEAQHVAIIVEALQNGPYKIVHPIIQIILGQLGRGTQPIGD